MAHGTNGTSVIRTLTVGQSVTIIETGKYNGLDGYDWSRVRLNDGSQGYLVSTYLNQVAQTNYQMAYVNCNSDGKVYVRSGVGTGSSIVTALGKDTKVTVLQKSAGSANGYTWDKIVTLDGLEGYMANNYLRYEESNSGNNNDEDSNNGDNSNENGNGGSTSGGNANTSAGVNDVDGNGIVNSADLYYIVKFLKENGDAYSQEYDVNKDNAVNSGDLYQVVLYLKQN
ncbi:MAG: SH3 domain-containing protein [Clostridia bacterium]|nr:SH3 domain-containing protein [Clostridia bacterium]